MTEPTDEEVLARAVELHEAECPCGKVITMQSGWIEYARMTLRAERD